MGTENFWDIEIGGLDDINLDLDINDEDKSLIVSTKTVPSKMIKYENAARLAARSESTPTLDRLGT